MRKIYQIIAILIFVGSVTPGLRHFYSMNHGRVTYDDILYSSYKTIICWLVALAGIGIGILFVWLANRPNPKDTAVQKSTGSGEMLWRWTLVFITAIAVACALKFAIHPKDQSVKLNDATNENFIAVKKTPATNGKIRTSANPLYMKKATDFTIEEKAELAKKFREQLKPAVEKWINAYKGRVPFNLNDLTFDTFNNRIGRNSSFYVYSFVFNGITLTVEERNGKVKVNYLMVRKAAIAVNHLPQKGFVPNFSVPIKRADVIRMVEADSGVEFKPNEIIIRPTAAATALNGGAFVHILPTGKDPNNALNYKISMIFGPDGKLVSYERDPFF